MTASTEMDLATFVQNPSGLDGYLTKFTTSEGLEFITYPHYGALATTWARYHQRLKDLFGFQIKKDDVVVDIGAHHGIVSANCAALGARVIALEPYPVNFEILKRNVALHPGFNIEVRNQAVSGKSGTAVFNCGKTSTTGALLEVGRDWKRTEHNYEVGCTSYADLLKSVDQPVKLMKVDCEGGEYAFLMDAPQELLRKVEFFYMEAHPTKFHQPADLEKFMRQQGYEVHAFEEVHGCFDLVCRRNG